VVAMARRVGCGIFVYTGSSSSYGDVPVPFDEDGPIRPYTPYAISKQVGETYVRASGLPYAIFRLFNVYGPGDPPGRYRNAIPNMVRVLLDAPRAAGRAVNVGTGQETPILELAREILRLYDLPENRLRFEQPRSWDRVVRRCASVERLRELFGRVPSTPLVDGLQRAAEWMHAAGYVARKP